MPIRVYYLRIYHQLTVNLILYRDIQPCFSLKQMTRKKYQVAHQVYGKQNLALDMSSHYLSGHSSVQNIVVSIKMTENHISEENSYTGK